VEKENGFTVRKRGRGKLQGQGEGQRYKTKSYGKQSRKKGESKEIGKKGDHESDPRKLWRDRRAKSRVCGAAHKNKKSGNIRRVMERIVEVGTRGPYEHKLVPARPGRARKSGGGYELQEKEGKIEITARGFV